MLVLLLEVGYGSGFDISAGDPCPIMDGFKGIFLELVSIV